MREFGQVKLAKRPGKGYSALAPVDEIQKRITKGAQYGGLVGMELRGIEPLTS